MAKKNTIKDWQNKFRSLVIEMEQDLGGDMPKVTITKRKRESYNDCTAISYPMQVTVAVDYIVEIEFGE